MASGHRGTRKLPPREAPSQGWGSGSWGARAACPQLLPRLPAVSFSPHSSVERARETRLDLHQPGFCFHFGRLPPGVSWGCSLQPSGRCFALWSLGNRHFALLPLLKLSHPSGTYNPRILCPGVYLGPSTCHGART